MNDVIIGGDIAMVARNVLTVSSLGIAVGLDLNATSASSYNIFRFNVRKGAQPLIFVQMEASPNYDLGDDLVIWPFPLVDTREASLLGSPLGAGTGME